VLYWLGDLADRERGWGRRDETFRATEELRRMEPRRVVRPRRPRPRDATSTEPRRSLAAREPPTVTAELAERFGRALAILPMTEQRVTTRIDVVDEHGRALDLHFQEYWVFRGAPRRREGDPLRGRGGRSAGPGVLEAIAGADAVVVCPSNPVASIGPILAVPGIADAVRSRRERGGRRLPIVAARRSRDGGRLMPVAGLEVSAAGAAEAYRGARLRVGDRRARPELAPRVEALGTACVATDTVMESDARAESVARAALALL
jgi:LPPG:FO 2-phospho-L-lactate transferase